MSEKQLDLILNELQKVNGRLDNIDGRLDNIDGRLDNVDGRLDNIDGRLDNIDGRLDNVDGRLDNIDGRLDNIEYEQKRHGEHIHQIIQIVGTTNAKLEELTEDVHRIQVDVTLLKENQQTVLQIQQEQQKILERLSFRSISQEADIAELRRVK